MFDIFVGMSINFKIYDNNFPEIFNKLSDENILKLRSDIRDEYETIIVGANTIKIDNPNLLNSKKNNIRLIIDKYADLSLDSNIFKNIPNQTYILLLKNKKEYIQNLKEMGVSYSSVKAIRKRVRNTYFFLYNNNVIIESRY